RVDDGDLFEVGALEKRGREQSGGEEHASHKFTPSGRSLWRFRFPLRTGSKARNRSASWASRLPPSLLPRRSSFSIRRCPIGTETPAASRTHSRRRTEPHPGVE